VKHLYKNRDKTVWGVKCNATTAVILTSSSSGTLNRHERVYDDRIMSV